MRLVACIAACALFPALAFAKGSLYLDPARASHEVGDVFEVKVRADTYGEMINAAEAELTFDPKALSVERLSTEGSILGSFSTEPAFSNETGHVKLSGWTREPYVGNDGLLVTISFKTLRATASNAHLVAGAALALQQGSNIIESMRSGLYTAGPERITPVPSDEPLPEEVPEEETETASKDEAPPEIPAIPTIEAITPIVVGERIIVRGVAEPEVRVWVRLVGPSVEGEAAVMSQESGAYEYTSGEIATDGIYRVSAFVEGQEGGRSETTERIIVEVQPAPLSSRLAAATGLLSASLPFAALVLVGGLAIGFLIHRKGRRER